MSIDQFIQARGIREIVHFTTNRGLVGVLAREALLSRPRLRADQLLKHVAYPNTKFRQEENAYFDRSQQWIDYVSLSITEPNDFFFNKSREWHLGEDIYWVILSFDPVIITHEGVFFSTTNNVYGLCERNPGLAGIELLFADNIRRKVGWSVRRVNKSENQPTCQQAEVLYRDQVSTEFLRVVYVKNREEMIYTKATLADYNRRDVEVVVAPEKFGAAAGGST